MEAVDLNFQVDLATVPRFMGIEGLVRAGVTVKELEPCDSGRGPFPVSPFTQSCSSTLSDKEATNVVCASETETCKVGGQLLSYQSAELSRDRHGRVKNGFLYNGAEGVQLERKPGWVSKVGSLSSKRLRIGRLEDRTTLTGVDGKDMSDNIGSYLTKCSSSDKTHSLKQKSNITSKRGDKRNLKLPVKNKHDSFCVKAGLTNFSPAAGGINFFGVHGLKSDNHDVTKLVDDVPLNDLLDGTYRRPSLGKDKGKKPENVNINFLHSVKKACTILQPPRFVQPQLNPEVHRNSDKLPSSWLFSTTSVVASVVNGDKVGPFITDLSSCNEVQESQSKPETPPNPLDLPLCEPKCILERLALPPHKDLESLLLDAAKSPLSSKNTPDQCAGKQTSRRASLPPFPWSQTSSWYCRSSSDAAKLSTSRGTCEGRWLRIDKNVIISLGVATNNFTDLESLTYDQSLVPSISLKMAGSRNKVSSPILSVTLPQDPSSNAICSKESHAPSESGGKANHSGHGNDEHCPKVLAAARTLCDMAAHPSRKNPDGIIRWPKKPSQKAMKACKLKSMEKPEEAYGTSVAASGLENLRSSADRMLPPKRPKLSLIDVKKEFNNFRSVRKGGINWSTPRSSRSPGKSHKESIVEIRHSSLADGGGKQWYMMPPSSRVPEKASNRQDKLREKFVINPFPGSNMGSRAGESQVAEVSSIRPKLLTTEWNRGRDRLD